MDSSSRTPLSPRAGAKRHRTPPTNEYGIPSAHHSQTSLPSFKQLEPYLRPQHMPSDPPSSHPYAGASHYSPHTRQQQESATSSQTMGASQRDSGIFGTGDSEPDEVGHRSPPKKKRRRQALSCTGDFLFCFFYPPFRWLTVILLGSSFSPFHVSFSLVPLSMMAIAGFDLINITRPFDRVQTTQDQVRSVS